MTVSGPTSSRSGRRRIAAPCSRDSSLPSAPARRLEPKVLALDSVIGGLEGLMRRLLGEDIRLEIRLTPEVGAVRIDPGPAGAGRRQPAAQRPRRDAIRRNHAPARPPSGKFPPRPAAAISDPDGTSYSPSATPARAWIPRRWHTSSRHRKRPALRPGSLHRARHRPQKRWRGADLERARAGEPPSRSTCRGWNRSRSRTRAPSCAGARPSWWSRTRKAFGNCCGRS